MYQAKKLIHIYQIPSFYIGTKHFILQFFIIINMFALLQDITCSNTPNERRETRFIHCEQKIDIRAIFIN